MYNWVLDRVHTCTVTEDNTGGWLEIASTHSWVHIKLADTKLHTVSLFKSPPVPSSLPSCPRQNFPTRVLNHNRTQPSRTSCTHFLSLFPHQQQQSSTHHTRTHQIIKTYLQTINFLHIFIKPCHNHTIISFNHQDGLHRDD